MPPTKCLTLKGNGLKKKIIQNFIMEYLQKLISSSTTEACNCMLNIWILAKAVLQIFCSQGCSYSKCLCLKKGSNSTKNFLNRCKSYSVHLHLRLSLYAKLQDPSRSGSSDILFTRLFIHSRKGSITPEQQDRWRKNKIRVSLFFHVNIRILAKEVLQIFCSQGSSYTKCLCPKKGSITQLKIYGICSKFNQFIYN